MLVLSRKSTQSIVVNGDIRITVVSIRGNQVRLGFEAPGSIAIVREELCDPARARDVNNRCAIAGAFGRRAVSGSTTTVGESATAPRDAKR